MMEQPMELQIGKADIVSYEGNMTQGIMVMHVNGAGEVASANGWQLVRLEQDGAEDDFMYKYYRPNRKPIAFTSGKVYRCYKHGVIMNITAHMDVNAWDTIKFPSKRKTFDDDEGDDDNDEDYEAMSDVMNHHMPAPLSKHNHSVQPWMRPLPHVDTPRPVVQQRDLLDQTLDHIMPIITEECRKIRDDAIQDAAKTRADADREAANIVNGAEQLRRNGIQFLRRKFVELHQIGERIITETVYDGEAQMQLAIRMAEDDMQSRWHTRGIEAYKQVHETARKRAREEVEQENADMRASLARQQAELEKREAALNREQQELTRHTQNFAKAKQTLEDALLAQFRAHADAVKRGREEGLAQAADDARRIRQKAAADVQAMIMRAQRSGSSSSVTP
jgi:hypothetical protein